MTKKRKAAFNEKHCDQYGLKVVSRDANGNVDLNVHLDLEKPLCFVIDKGIVDTIIGDMLFDPDGDQECEAVSIMRPFHIMWINNSLKLTIKQVKKESGST